jgi:hypothetical protein
MAGGTTIWFKPAARELQFIELQMLVDRGHDHFPSVADATVGLAKGR